MWLGRRVVPRYTGDLMANANSCGALLQTMEVCAPAGSPIGFIEQEWTLCTPAFRILNKDREIVLKIEGPFITVSCFGDVEFQVLYTSSTQLTLLPPLFIP